MTEETNRKPGRPKSEPTTMTSVNLPPELHAPAPQMCAQIEAWLDRIDTEELIGYALERSLKIMRNHGDYRPYAFRVDVEGLQMSLKKTDPRNVAAVREMQKSFRIQVRLLERVRNTAAKLATSPSEIIRLALIDAFPDGGKELLDTSFYFEKPYLSVPSKLRKRKEKNGI